ncbi:hypothetical protein RDI58_001049 [Solanum bulbocastanum]|uniref:Uncharacterized protein n=1 Tax=Solanum bulbocastanum TaxID=147425 RepID=A0AAN8YPM0_SOLBU
MFKPAISSIKKRKKQKTK